MSAEDTDCDKSGVPGVPERLPYAKLHVPGQAVSANMSTQATKQTADAAERLLHYLKDAIVIVDTEGTIVLANPEAEDMFGYAAGELLGQPVETLVPDDSGARHRTYRARYKGKPHSRPLMSGLDLHGQRKDGSTFKAEIALTPLDGPEGQYIASTIRDISAGDTSEAYYRHLLQAAPDAMVIVDDQGRIAIVNDQSEKMFGYTREQLVGQPIETLLPDAVRSRHVHHRRKYIKDPRVRPMGIDMELYARRADGTEFPVEISLSPVKSATGDFVSSVIRDVTRRKQMETDLIEARQAAERAHKANTAFLAAASHDLRQPVQALSLLNGALRRTVTEPLAKEMVESQQHSLDAMTNLLNSLLDISRLDAGAVKPDIEDFPARRLIDRLSAESARQARQKGLVFIATANDTIIRSDPNLLSEIIQNLVSNAIRYTDTGEITLSCRLAEDRLSIEVRDTGVGIEPEHFEEIFREFHQLRSARDNSEGFGLGLAIVRRMADLLDHEIVVTSVPGEGSCFSVVVPVVDPIVDKEAGIAPAAPAAEQSGVAPDGVILLVEDDLAVARAWAMLLRAEGYRVLLAQSADEATSVAGELERPPELIISDFHLLDGSNGVQAVTKVRRAFGKNLPAFIVSGDTSKVVDEAKGLANSVLLSKPVHTDDLLAMARKAIVTGLAT
jgi:protein-histidine pros-kinase